MRRPAGAVALSAIVAFSAAPAGSSTCRRQRRPEGVWLTYHG